MLTAIPRTLSLLLVLAGALGCSARSARAPMSTDAVDAARLAIRTDAVTYHLVPNARVPGAHRLQLLVTLSNPSPDTVLLRFPCDLGPRPARTFLFANNLSPGILGLQACLASAAGFGPDTHGFTLPPRATVVDSVVVNVPDDRAGEPRVRLAPYLGTYRLAYSRRRPPRPWRRDWTDVPLAETLSNPFRVLPPT